MPDDPVVRPPSVFDAEDLVDAVTDLCSRVGAHSVEIGYSLRSGQESGPADWYAYAAYYGGAISERGHPSPAAACYALACRLVAGVHCACRLPVALDPGRTPGLTRPWAAGEQWGISEAREAGWCLWEPYMKRWRAGCGMLPFEVPGSAVAELPAAAGDASEGGTPALLLRGARVGRRRAASGGR
ncbi:hypothetical protein [Streptomyces violaceusniger]|uniref:Uncharacterized protein n=1 Tax=Streptomyces violaceusniger (strain Tu 4113) TaxID=653045 RepID=G2PHT9_STRV4|nr:hypothetical protein [Streptomyces violaceusniger]AEM88890.1 hypothetical protein Strvi_0114 [Streptomyces violaceusniger Tu 4113]